MTIVLQPGQSAPQRERIVGAVHILGKGRTGKERLSLPPKTAAALRAWIACHGAAPGPLFTRLTRDGSHTRLTGSGLYFVVRLLGESTKVRLWF